jgi:hypothetical protein
METIDQESREQGPAAIVLFYEPSSGEIVHGHYHEVEHGSALPDRAALVKLATENAKRFANRRKPFDVDKLQILHVDASDFHFDRRYKVDTKAGRLVEIGKPPGRDAGRT